MYIRPLKIEDVPSIVPLMQQLGYPSNIEQLHLRFHKLLNMPDYQTFIAEVEGELVGFVGLTQLHAYEFDEPYIKIAALVVDASHRRQHIGKSLMQAAEKWARQQGCVAVTLNSGNRTERKNAHLFYNS